MKPLHTVTIKVEEDLKRRMRKVRVNWSAYIRATIEERIRLEAQREAASTLREGMRGVKGRVPVGFIEGAIRDGRENR